MNVMTKRVVLRACHSSVARCVSSNNLTTWETQWWCQWQFSLLGEQGEPILSTRKMPCGAIQQPLAAANDAGSSASQTTTSLELPEGVHIKLTSTKWSVIQGRQQEGESNGWYHCNYRSVLTFESLKRAWCFLPTTRTVLMKNSCQCYMQKQGNLLHPCIFPKMFAMRITRTFSW